jgi:O-antigen/teichoic acid export membrane protein
MGSLFLGIYYNLSVWYKLTNRNMFGAYITIAGAVITVLLNIWWIPEFGYYGSAWATFVCYAFMMVISYIQGQKYYQIPYAWKKLLAYLVLVSLIYLVHQGILFIGRRYLPAGPGWGLYQIGTALVLLAAFTIFVLKVEKKEFIRLPIIGRFIQQYA